MSELDDRILQEFLADGEEGLDQLDRDLVELEQRPDAKDALDRAFRVLHTIKGTCSFLGYRRLERLAHAGESLLARVRGGEAVLGQPAMAALLAVVDGVRAILKGIAETRREPEGDDAACLATIEALHRPAAAPARATPAAAVPSTPDAEATPEDAAPLAHDTVRVDVARLDRIVNLVGELVLSRNQVVQFTAQRDTAALAASVQRLDHVTTRLQEEILRTRMQAISALWMRMPRTVRDVAGACGKQVRLEMEGTQTELDKTLIEAIKDPLLHLVRNAIDHGIESPAIRKTLGKPEAGQLRLRAFHEGGQFQLEIADDGAGLPLERIRMKAVERRLVTSAQAAKLGEAEIVRFIFLPGFSTAQRVTAVSGRGVGMDVVKSSIDAIGGSIDVQTRAGGGTTLRIRIPLTLAIFPALIVESMGGRYAIPQVHLLELVPLRDESTSLESVHGALVHRLRGTLLPVLRLHEQLGFEDEPDRRGRRVLAVLRADGREFGLVVDGVFDTEEIVVKPLVDALRAGGVYAGATVRGDGQVALILDVPGLARRAGLTPLAETPPAAPAATGAPHDSEPVVIAALDARWRVAIPLPQVERIEEVVPDAIEGPAHAPVVRWRDGVIPVASLATRLGGAVRRWDDVRRWRVLVHLGARGPVGWLVERVDDIVDAPIRAAAAAAGHGGSHAIVDGHVLTLVDLARLDAPAVREAA